MQNETMNQTNIDQKTYRRTSTVSCDIWQLAWEITEGYYAKMEVISKEIITAKL